MISVFANRPGRCYLLRLLDFGPQIFAAKLVNRRTVEEYTCQSDDPNDPHTRIKTLSLAPLVFGRVRGRLGSASSLYLRFSLQLRGEKRMKLSVM